MIVLGDERKSLGYWAQSHQIFIDMEVLGGVAGVTSKMSTALANTGKPEKGIEFANSALKIWREIGNPWGEAGTLHTLGWIYENLGQHEKALNYFQQALPTHRMNNSHENLYYTLRGMGEAEQNLGHSQQALVDDLAALGEARTQSL
jgi:tetratricopeptide (TPR) repeat protein